MEYPINLCWTQNWLLTHKCDLDLAYWGLKYPGVHINMLTSVQLFNCSNTITCPNLANNWTLFFIKLFFKTKPHELIVSESDILGLKGNLSDIKNLVSIERELFEDSSYKYRIKIFQLFMSISPLWNTCLKHHKRCTCQ